MNPHTFARLLGIFAALALGSISTSAVGACPGEVREPGVASICGIHAPEDLAVWQDRYVISSAMEPAAHLFVLDTRSEVIAPMVTTIAMPGAAENWGDPSCPAPASMISHGIDLVRRTDGAWQVLVVNHEGRESIELFELLPRTGRAPALRWRGCVLAADNAQFNDVAGLPDGSFLATDPITASWQLARMLLGNLGMDTGQVYRWTPGQGYAVVPGTEGAYPNGVLLSADGESFYLNLYLDGEVREHDLATGEVLGRVAVTKPDNSALGRDGQLLVASHGGSIFPILQAILGEPYTRNTIPFEIVAIDTGTFTRETVFASAGTTQGGGTVAVPAGDSLYIGAFKGDRILRIKDPAAP